MEKTGNQIMIDLKRQRAQDRLNAMSDELFAFCQDNALPYWSADEIKAELQDGGNRDHHPRRDYCLGWLNGFIEEWRDMVADL